MVSSPDRPDLELDPAAVLGLASQAQTTADEVAGNARFKNLRLSADMLGGFSSAAGVVDAHGSAHAVVSETIDGVRKDLEAFSGYLRKAVEGIEGADHLSSGALTRLAEISIGSETERANRDARDKYVASGPASGPGDG
ncbi:MAG: hypothetical protein ABWX84_01675 [Nocardioides sp.]